MSNANEPAFPNSIPIGCRDSNGTPYGLTKREHIAALALQGWLASFTDPDCGAKPSKCAEFAVECADALIKELERPHD